MNTPPFLFGLFLVEVCAIYFLSHHLLNTAYRLLRKVISSDSAIIWLVALLYLPGTILHELSHYFFALLLAMHPEEVSILPHIERNHIQLGHVLYRKHRSDFIRPIIVGIAPFFGAIAALWTLQSFHLFPGSVWWQTALFGYLILAITANMFSSKQDLIDLVYVVPIFLVAGLVLYLFPVQINARFAATCISALQSFVQTLQVPLLFSLSVHGILIVIIKIILSFL